MKKKNGREFPGRSSVVAPAGIEPASSESESEILSIEIRSQIIQVNNLKKSTIRFLYLHLLKQQTLQVKS